jgi:hypothetical protein
MLFTAVMYGLLFAVHCSSSIGAASSAFGKEPSKIKKFLQLLLPTLRRKDQWSKTILKSRLSQ